MTAGNLAIAEMLIVAARLGGQNNYHYNLPPFTFHFLLVGDSDKTFEEKIKKCCETKTVIRIGDKESTVSDKFTTNHEVCANHSNINRMVLAKISNNINRPTDHDYKFTAKFFGRVSALI